MSFKREWLQRQHHIHWANKSFLSSGDNLWLRLLAFLPFYLQRCLQILFTFKKSTIFEMIYITYIKLMQTLLTLDFIVWSLDEDFSHLWIHPKTHVSPHGDSKQASEVALALQERLSLEEDRVPAIFHVTRRLWRLKPSKWGFEIYIRFFYYEFGVWNDGTWGFSWFNHKQEDFIH